LKSPPLVELVRAGGVDKWMHETVDAIVAIAVLLKDAFEPAQATRR
jgi:hypothetical protein